MSDNHKYKDVSEKNKAILSGSLTTLKVADWGCDEVKGWLETLHLGHLDSTFRFYAVNGSLLLHLTRKMMLGEMDITEIQALVLEKAIAKLKVLYHKQTSLYSKLMRAMYGPKTQAKDKRRSFTLFSELAQLLQDSWEPGNFNATVDFVHRRHERKMKRKAGEVDPPLNSPPDSFDQTALNFEDAEPVFVVKGDPEMSRFTNQSGW